MNEAHETLLKLQEIDQEIDEARRRVEGFDPELETLEEPLAQLETEAKGVRTRLEEMRAEIRRLERAAEEKRERQKKYEDHLSRARNTREEAAARAELDLVRKAADTDEQEAMDLDDAATRTELKLDELESKLAATRAEIEPRRAELMAGRESAQEELEVLADRRENEAIRMDDRSRRLYEQVRGGRTRQVLSRMTEDGACGLCFSVLPIQKQTEIRRGSELVRCEACGVILYAD